MLKYSETHFTKTPITSININYPGLCCIGHRTIFGRMKTQEFFINLVSFIQSSLKSARRTPVDVTVSVSGYGCSGYVTVNVNRLLTHPQLHYFCVEL